MNSTSPAAPPTPKLSFLVLKIDWDNYAECMPTFLVILGIPITFSIADGLALGFITYPIIKLLAGQGRDVKWLMYVMAIVLVAYFLVVRARVRRCGMTRGPGMP